MSTPTIARQDVLRVLREQLLPQAERKSLAFAVARLPMASTPAIRVEPQKAPLLKPNRRPEKFTVLSHWKEEGINAMRFPALLYVVEGNADFHIGVTPRMVEQNRLDRKFGRYKIVLPEHSLLLLPRGIPVSDASRPHWERPDPESAYSRLLWIRFLPSGASMHFCQTRGTEHSSTPTLFVTEPRLSVLAMALVEELPEEPRYRDELARAYVTTIGLHLEYNLSHRFLPMEECQASVPSSDHLDRPALQNGPVQRAREYIESHFREPLTLDKIAAQAYVSPTHLNRLFQSEMSTTTMNYLMQWRLQQACILLEETALPAQYIGVLVGYPSQEYFNRAFKKHTGRTPGAYRRLQSG